MAEAWEGTTYGNARMHQWLIAMLRHVDVRLIYALCAVFVVPVCLIVQPSRAVIYRYFRLRHHMGRMQAAWHTYRNHWLFSQCVVDKFAMYAGRHFHTTIVGYDHYLQLEQQSEAFVQLSAHIGNYEIAGFTLRAEHKAFNALVFGAEKATVMAERSKLLARDNIRLIPLSQDMSHIFLLSEALQRGEILSMPADRQIGSSLGARTIPTQLLGAEVRLPAGPFEVAAMRALNVLAVHVVKTSLRGYTIHVLPLRYDKSAPRRERALQLANAYTDTLEQMLRQWPDQWFNFYDFFAHA